MPPAALSMLAGAPPEPPAPAVTETEAAAQVSHALQSHRGSPEAGEDGRMQPVSGTWVERRSRTSPLTSMDVSA